MHVIQYAMVRLSNGLVGLMVWRDFGVLGESSLLFDRPRRYNGPDMHSLTALCALAK